MRGCINNMRGSLSMTGWVDSMRGWVGSMRGWVGSMRGWVGSMTGWVGSMRESGLLITCGQSHTVQITQFKRDVDTCGKDISRRDARQVTQSQAVDDVGGSTGTASIDEIFDWLKGVGGVVFGCDTNEQT